MRSGCDRMSQGSMVALEGFSFRYAGATAPAVSNIDLRVAGGECVVLTGRSGCGKTTLTRAVNGLIPLVYRGESGGCVAIGGRPLPEWGYDALTATVGSVFQSPRSQLVNDEVTAEIAFGCENQGLAREVIAARVRESAADMGITDLIGRGVDQLSGGEVQMVVTASAHAAHPDVYVLDEPTAALSVRSMRRLGRAIARLKAQGKAIIISEHRLWWIADVADRVVVIEDGRIREDLPAAGFAAIPPDVRAAWGLRAWTVDEMEAVARRRSAGGRVRRGTAAPALRVRGLRAGYRGGRDVLNGIDLTVAAGSAVGIVGSNGAGKTTLARCLCGLQRERGGTVELFGRLSRCGDRVGTVHLVMQNPGYQLFEHSVRRELVAARDHRGRSRSGSAPAVQAMLRDLDLLEVAERHPLSLSGGQLQRVSIAAGMLHGAHAMVMDEPTSGLDRQGMMAISHQIERARQRALGVCVITHDYEFLCATCDEVVHLDAGRAGPPIELCGETIDEVGGLMGLTSQHSSSKEGKGQ